MGVRMGYGSKRNRDEGLKVKRFNARRKVVGWQIKSHHSTRWLKNSRSEIRSPPPGVLPGSFDLDVRPDFAPVLAVRLLNIVADALLEVEARRI